MTSLLMRDPLPQSPSSEQPENQSGDFEIVLGKRQIAGVLFVASVLAALFSAVSYIAGEASAPHRTVAEERPAPVPPAPAPAATVEITKPVVNPAPLFAEPNNGELYLQMGALDKGIAVIFAEGLRTHGFDAFVASGPSEKVFRVLIGPLVDQQTYKRTKDAIDDLGLTAFARKTQQ